MNLETNYLGRKLKNPLIAGASPMSDSVDSVRALEDAGISAITMYSLYEEQISQNMVGSDGSGANDDSSFVEAASSHAAGILDRGVDQYLEQLQAVKSVVDIPVYGSLNGNREGDWTDYASLIQSAGADALELNLYCLATSLDESAADMEASYLRIVSRVRKRISIPLVVKLSPSFTALPHFSKQLVDSGVNALVLFNRFYQPDINIDKFKINPSLKLSYSQELRLRLRWLAMLSGRIDCEFAASGGVHTAVDVMKALMAGANTVQLVSTLLINGPERATQILEELEKWMGEKELSDLQTVRGSMNYSNLPDPEAYERANFIRILGSWRP
ncbi:MAG: dihydroorotate dehydrogenase-like protein [Opitutaceae bacterium]